MKAAEWEYLLDLERQRIERIKSLEAEVKHLRWQRDDLQARNTELVEQRRTLAWALLGTAQAHDGTDWCWCAYTQLIHPPDDPQDGVALEANFHTKECNAARVALKL